MSQPINWKHPTPAESFDLWEELFESGGSWSDCDHFARAFLSRWGSSQTINVSPEEAKELVSELRAGYKFCMAEGYNDTAELLRKAAAMIELFTTPTENLQ